MVRAIDDAMVEDMVQPLVGTGAGGQSRAEAAADGRPGLPDGGLVHLLLYYAVRLFGQPLTTVIVGIAIGMLASALVNDPSPRQRKITMLLLPVVAGATLAVGTFVAPTKSLSDAIFFCVIFAGVFVRRFGPRGMALGMIAFMSYFFSLFFHAKLAQVPMLAESFRELTGAPISSREKLRLARVEQALRAAARSGSAQARERVARELKSLPSHMGRSHNLTVEVAYLRLQCAARRLVRQEPRDPPMSFASRQRAENAATGGFKTERDARFFAGWRTEIQHHSSGASDDRRGTRDVCRAGDFPRLGGIGRQSRRSWYLSERRRSATSSRAPGNG